MGWEARTIKITVSLDAHGGPKERRDEMRYRKLVAELRAVCDNSPLIVHTSGMDDE